MRRGAVGHRWKGVDYAEGASERVPRSTRGTTALLGDVLVCRMVGFHRPY